MNKQLFECLPFWWHTTLFIIQRVSSLTYTWNTAKRLKYLALICVTPNLFCRIILEIIGHPVTLQTLVHKRAILKIWNFTFWVCLGVTLCVFIKPSINILFRFTFTIFQCRMTFPYVRFSFKNDINIIVNQEQLCTKLLITIFGHLFDSVWRCLLEHNIVCHSTGSVFFYPLKSLFLAKIAIFYSTPVSFLSPVPNVFKHVTSFFTYMISYMLISICSCLFFSRKLRFYSKAFFPKFIHFLNFWHKH